MKKKLLIVLVLLFIVVIFSGMISAGEKRAQSTLDHMLEQGIVGFEPSREGEFAGFNCKFSRFSSEWNESASWQLPSDFQKWKKSNGNDSVGIEYADFCVFYGQWELKPYKGEARLAPKK
jgi:hypothetical protein